MKSFLQRLFVYSFLVSTAVAEELPNIVFINADDLTYTDLSVYGGQGKTPNFDRLAAEGMTFSHCFQAAPMCSPTRHNLYTGIYPVKTGAYPNHTFAKEGTKSIAYHLQPHGYRVALSGKRHISPESVFPFEYSSSLSDLSRTAAQIQDSAQISLLPHHLFTNKFLKIMKILTRT